MSKEFKDAFGEECNFTVEQQFKVFSKMIGLDRMAPIQIEEMTKAFYAGFNQAFMLFTNEISNLEDDDKAIEILDNLAKEMDDFLAEEIRKYAKRKESGETS